MKMGVFQAKTVLHTCFWVIFFFAPILLSPPGDMERAFFYRDNLISLILRNALLAALFYVNLSYLTPKVWQQKGFSLFLVIAFGLVVFVSIANWQIHQFLSEPQGPPPPWSDEHGPRPHGNSGHRPIMFASPLFSSVLTSLIIMVFSSSLFLWQDWNATKERMREQELEKKNAELAALKLQISPHFLFNTLNNIRWLVRSGAPQAEDAVVQLSQLLRYILYETAAEKVPLEKEIAHLAGYIQLQTMRLANPDTFYFQVVGEPSGKEIVPLLLLPIVENLFKHGDFSAGNNNRITLTMDDRGFTFDAENKILTPETPTPKDNSGIGLSNFYKRLEMHYPHAHTISRKEENGTFHIHLKITLA